jgi:hypothetical protein
MNIKITIKKVNIFFIQLIQTHSIHKFIVTFGPKTFIDKFYFFISSTSIYKFNIYIYIFINYKFKVYF